MTHLRILPKPLITKKRALVGVTALFFLFLIIPQNGLALGTVETLVAESVAYIAEKLIVNPLGWLFIKITHVLINWVAPYNNFIGAAGPANHPVTVGWTIVRDLSNMFFIVVLLVIAFGTMFKIEAYDYKKLLPRLLIMAVLINFSRTITGLVIDAAQVAMLTFVNAFQAAAGGNIVTGLGIPQLFDVSRATVDLSLTNAIATYLFAIIFLTVALMTMVIITMTLIARIVMLWIITIMSPAAFLLSTFPRGQKYYAEWWDKLICWAFSGPVLAFFLWLALATMVDAGADVGPVKTVTGEGKDAIGSSLVSEAAAEHNIVRFLVGIMMLLAGVQISQQFCAIGTGLVSGAGAFVKGKAVGAAKAVGRLGVGTALLPPKALIGGAKAVGGYVDYKTGIRKGAYRTLGGIGFRRFATEGLAKLQETPSKTFKATEVAAAVAATTDAKIFASLVKRKPIVATAEGDARRAADIKAALGNKDVRKELGNTEVISLFKEYGEIATRSGNKDIVDGYKDLKKIRPDLLDNPTKIRDQVRGMNLDDLSKMDLDAFNNESVVGTLKDRFAKTPKFEEDLRRRLSGEATSRLDATLPKVGAAPPPLSAIPDANVRRARVQAMSDDDLKSLPRDELAKLLPDLDRLDKTDKKQRVDLVLKAKKVDLSALDPVTLTPELAFKIADTSDLGELERMATTQPALAERFKNRLSTYVLSPPKPLTDDQRVTVNVAKAIGGLDAGATPVTVKASFGGNLDNIGKALQGQVDQVKALLRHLQKTGEVADPDIRKVVSEKIDLKIVEEMVLHGDPGAVSLGIDIANDIEGGMGGKKRAKQLKKNPTLNAVV